jgi:L-ascorbate metabolism protein UlaG (beta-lactamase superfamily)
METGTQAGAETMLHWFGHASFRIRHKGTIIYIDPWKLPEAPQDATVVLVSHAHHDHYSPPDIAKVKGCETELLAPVDVVDGEGSGQVLLPGLTIAVGPVRITGVAAYNPHKQFHPKDRKWVGFLIELGGRRLYYAGDTDLTEEMRALGQVDVALLPVGGTYTMNAEEAAQAVRHLQPRIAIPCHWGDIVGQRSDAEKFAQLCRCEVRILNEGQSTTLNG